MPPYIQDGDNVREMTWAEWTAISGIEPPPPVEDETDE